MPRGFSEDQISSLRQKLLKVAVEKLHVTGIRKTTVEEIARAANISTGAFYKFYPSKEALFFEAYEISEERLKSELIELLEAHQIITRMDLGQISRQLIHSETMLTLMQLMQKDELEYMLRNIDINSISEHSRNDEKFAQHMFEVIESKGLKVQTDIPLMMSYLQALFVLCYEKKNFALHAEKIIDSFLDMMIDQFIS